MFAATFAVLGAVAAADVSPASLPFIFLTIAALLISSTPSAVT